MGRDEVILLDTHALVWLLTENSSLGRRAKLAADKALAEGELAVSAISFWEIGLLVHRGRMSARSSPAAQRTMILEAGALELSLTGEIAIRAAELEGLPADPADRFIAATALAHNATLMTADEGILGWRHTLRRQDASK
jgi:PIN domain nuclease of toxin-antitoxin system